MRLSTPIPFPVVVQSWLQAEWYLPHFDAIRASIPAAFIESVDVNQPQMNQQKLDLLRSIRSPIIDPLPADTEWHTTSIDKNDLQRIFTVPSNDWATVSSNTYHPLKVIENLHMDDGHAKKINEIKNSLDSNLDKRIVMVGTSVNSPLTIIEGNHRAVALFADALEKDLQNPIIEEVFIGISPAMKDYVFHIEKYMV